MPRGTWPEYPRFSTTLFPFVRPGVLQVSLGTKPQNSKSPRFPILWYYTYRPKIVESLVSAVPETSKPRYPGSGRLVRDLSRRWRRRIGRVSNRQNQKICGSYASPCKSCPSSKPLPAWVGLSFRFPMTPHWSCAVAPPHVPWNPHHPLVIVGATVRRCLPCSLLRDWLIHYKFACDSYIVTDVQGWVPARDCCLFWAEESCPSKDCVRLQSGWALQTQQWNQNCRCDALDPEATRIQTQKPRERKYAKKIHFWSFALFRVTAVLNVRRPERTSLDSPARCPIRVTR